MDFPDQVDLWIRAKLDSGVNDWPGLVAGLPGVYPEQVLASLHRQNLCDAISFPSVATKVHPNNNDSSIAHRLWTEGDLPTPHPLDACWWFANCSFRSLLGHLQRNASSPRHVVLLGIPSFFHLLRKKAILDRVTLVDSDPDVRSAPDGDCRYRVVTANLLGDELPAASGDVVIADPPWYEPEIRAFLWAARHLCTKGGVILTSVPPAGARPGIGDEWSRTLRWTRGLGLELVDYEKHTLRYISPLFERNALAAAGIHGVQENWRSGDLAVFRCEGPVIYERPRYRQLETWEQCSIGGVRFRVRVPSQAADPDPTLHPLVLGDVLDSVSRRDSRRDQVDVWTSGNRAFRCTGRAILLQILRSLSSNEGLGRRTPVQQFARASELARNTAARVEEIVQIEKNESSSLREMDDSLDIWSG